MNKLEVDEINVQTLDAGYSRLNSAHAQNMDVDTLSVNVFMTLSSSSVIMIEDFSITGAELKKALVFLQNMHKITEPGAYE